MQTSHDSAQPPATLVNRWAWLAPAIGWTAGVAVLGWALVGLLVAGAWLTAPRLSAAAVVSTMGQGWLAVHGVPATLGGADVRLIPWGLTLPLILACALAAQNAARQITPRPASGADTWRLWAAVVGACVLTYVAFGTVIASVVGDAAQTLAALGGLTTVCLAGAVPGAISGLRINVLRSAPAWVRRLPVAIALGSGVVLGGAALAAAVALVSGWPRVAALHQALATDAVSSLLLVLVQLCWWPTLLVWAASFVLGAGVQIGSGTVVYPGTSVIGSLPGLPVLGALPVVGATSDWAWVLVGLAAGGVTGWWMACPLVRGGGLPILTGAWHGALAGFGTALVWVLLAWLATGDLGSHRLADVGPRFPAVLGWTLVPLTVAGLAVGATWVAVRGGADEAEDEAEDSLG